MNTPIPNTEPVQVDPHVKVTMHEIYGLLLSVQKELIEMKSELPSVKDHETRIRALEKWVWGAAGIGMVAGIFFNQIVGKLIP